MIRKLKKTQRCFNYLSKKIENGDWKPEDKLPSIRELTRKMGVSYPTLKIVLDKFEKQKIITNYGRLGYFVTATNLSNTFKQNKLQYLLSMASIYRKSAALMNGGGQQIDKYIIKHNEDRIFIFNMISGKHHTFYIQELYDMLDNHISILDVIHNKDNRDKWLIQKEYINAAKLLKWKEII